MSKQIEEMAKIIRDFAKELDGKCIYLLATCEDDKLKDSVHAEIAEALYNAGYCNVDETEKMKFYKEAYEQGKFDANAEIAVGEKVVISKEEYEKLKFNETLCEAIRADKKLEVETARKETAREILQEFWNIQYGQTELDNVCIRLAEKYGVEVE